MKGIRLRSLMLVIVIVALVIALFVQHDRSERRLAELKASSGSAWELISEKRGLERELKRWKQRVKESEERPQGQRTLTC